jgi:hypothetical protein
MLKSHRVQAGKAASYLWLGSRHTSLLTEYFEAGQAIHKSQIKVDNDFRQFELCRLTIVQPYRLSDNLIISRLVQFLMLHKTPSHDLNTPYAIHTLETSRGCNSQSRRNALGLMIDNEKNI